MANLTSNPLLATAAATLWTGTPKSVRLVQWVDDNGDLAHDSILTLVVNGVEITATIQPLAAELAFGAVAWQLGPFNPGVVISDFVVSAMNEGNLHVWLT